MISQLIERAKKENVKRIKEKCIPTQKNKHAENFYKEFGFIQEGNYWVFDVDKTMKKIEHIKMINDE